MKSEKQQEIALMRYGAIAPLVSGLDENYPSKTAFYTEISNKGIVGPDGRVHHYAPATIEKWYLDYQNHGFDALIPKSRADAGMSRKLDDDLQERMKEDKYYQIILMLLYNGTRISEFLDLKKENVHLEEQYFDVIDSKTENGIRKVPIADKLLPYYKDWYNSSPDCEYLLHTEDGKRFLYRNYYDSYWTPLVEQIGIDRTPHCTRHTCISMLSEAGVQDTTIKKIVGHSGAMTLTEKVYTHLDMQVLVDAINKTLEDEDSVTADTKSA